MCRVRDLPRRRHLVYVDTYILYIIKKKPREKDDIGTIEGGEGETKCK